jgi:toxin ParE1/3/4
VKRVTFHAEADAEMIDAAKYYETSSHGLGFSFLLEVESATGQIAVNPDACGLISDSIRRKILRRFPYSILYSIESDRIRIVAVAHHQRRPDYWRSRL